MSDGELPSPLPLGGPFSWSDKGKNLEESSAVFIADWPL
jgi:hypothetical protein